MKRFLILLVIASAVSSCSYFRKTANTEAPANTANAQPTYPVFTDANEALAEGKRLLDENQTEAAIDALHQAVKLNPDLAEAWFQLGIGYSLAELQMAHSGNVEEQPANAKERVKPNSEKAFEKAVEAYKKWIEANPKDDAAYYNLGRTYSKLMKDDEAEDAFREAVKLKPDDSDYQMELGAILIKLAKYREAIDPLKKSVELDPTNERAQELLEDAEAGRQRLDYVPPKNANSSNSQSSNSNSTSNANTNSNSASTSNSNAAPRPTASNSKVTKEEPKKTPPANKPH
jgi:cytochrome c-type biogenesis protein CcmH/NrfG